MVMSPVLLARMLVSVLVIQQWVSSYYMPKIPRNDELLCLGNSEMHQLVLRALEIHRKCSLLLTVTAIQIYLILLVCYAGLEFSQTISVCKKDLIVKSQICVASSLGDQSKTVSLVGLVVLDLKCRCIVFIVQVQLPHSALICPSVLKDFYCVVYISVFIFFYSLCKIGQDVLNIHKLSI